MSAQEEWASADTKDPIICKGHDTVSGDLAMVRTLRTVSGPTFGNSSTVFRTLSSFSRTPVVDPRKSHRTGYMLRDFAGPVLAVAGSQE